MSTINIKLTGPQNHQDARRQIIDALDTYATVTVDASGVENLWPALLECLSSAAMKARTASRRLIVKCGRQDRYHRMLQMGWETMLELVC